MSLNFSYKNVVNKDEDMLNPLNEKEWHQIGNALVWISLVCGFREITEKNHKQVAQRVMEYQAVKGPLLEYQVEEDGVRKKRSLYIDTPEVKRYIGLSTNASSMTDREWNKHLLSIVSSDVGDIRWCRKDEPSTFEQFNTDMAAIKARREKETT